jgi:hypothetical protein
MIVEMREKARVRAAQRSSGWYVWEGGVRPPLKAVPPALSGRARRLSARGGLSWAGSGLYSRGWMVSEREVMGED